MHCLGVAQHDIIWGSKGVTHFVMRAYDYYDNAVGLSIQLSLVRKQDQLHDATVCVSICIVHGVATTEEGILLRGSVLGQS